MDSLGNDYTFLAARTSQISGVMRLHLGCHILSLYNTRLWGLSAQGPLLLTQLTRLEKLCIKDFENVEFEEVFIPLLNHSGMRQLRSLCLYNIGLITESDCFQIAINLRFSTELGKIDITETVLTSVLQHTPQ